MENFKYSLSKKGKSTCPACSKKTFVLYVDYSDNPLHSTVGKCDRADNCGHHYSPKQYFADNHIPFDETVLSQNNCFRPITPQPEPSYIDMEIMKRTMAGYDNNRFIQYLTGIVGDESAKEATIRYFIGTSKHWDGATVFWQIDQSGHVRTGKIMQYDQTTGKRIKEPVNRISWAHTVLKLQDFNLSQCLFGEHLLRDTTSPVAIVESEKTAIIASCYLPDFIWLACGGSEGLNLQKCAILKSRNIILYPDSGQFAKWSEKAKELSKICFVSVSNLIEQNATDEERQSGFDLADYLVRYSPTEFQNKQPETKSPEKGDFEKSTNPIVTSKPTKPSPAKPVSVTAKPLNYPKGNTPCYVDSTGRLYIQTRRQSYAIYQSTDHLMSPSVLPAVVPINAIDLSGMNKIFINY